MLGLKLNPVSKRGHWADKVIQAQRTSDRIFFLKLIIGNVVFAFLSVYTPQVNYPEAIKECFYDELQHTDAKVPANEIFIPVGDWNGNVGAATRVHSDAHSGNEFTFNAEGERVLEFTIANGLRQQHLVQEERLPSHHLQLRWPFNPAWLHTLL